MTRLGGFSVRLQEEIGRIATAYADVYAPDKGLHASGPLDWELYSISVVGVWLECYNKPYKGLPGSFRGLGNLLTGAEPWRSDPAEIVSYGHQIQKAIHKRIESRHGTLINNLADDGAAVEREERRREGGQPC
jgi:hypothetical protein